MAAPNPKPAKGRTGGRQTVNYVNVKGRQMSAVVTGGTGGVDEVQRITITGTPTGGTFTVTYRGATTAAIAYDANAAAVRSAIAALSTVGGTSNVTTSGGALPGTAVDVTFTAGLGHRNNPMMTTTDSFTGGSSPASAVTEVTAGAEDTSLNLYVPQLPQANRRKTGIAKRTSLTQTNRWWS